MMHTNPIAIPSQRGTSAPAARNTGNGGADPFAQMLERQRASTAAAERERTPAAERPKPAVAARPTAADAATSASSPAPATDAAAALPAASDAAPTDAATQPATPSDATLAQAAAAAIAPPPNPLVSQIQQLTERSRLLADTVVALKTHPAELPTDPATLTQWLNGELPLPDTAAAAAAATETPELLPATALASASVATAPALPATDPDALPTAAAPQAPLPAATATATATAPTSGWQAPAAAPVAAGLTADASSAAMPTTTGAAPLTAEAGAPRLAQAGGDTLVPAAASATPAAAETSTVWLPPLQAAGSQQPAAALPAAIQAQVAVPLQSPQWGAAFGQQIVRLGTDGQQGLRHVELRLDPPDLGPVRISLSLAGEQASAWFISPHAAVRQAIEQALPQLQQALADAGIQLGHTSVGEQHDAQTAQDDTAGRGQPNDATQLATDDAGTQLPATRAAPRGLIDTFA